MKNCNCGKKSLPSLKENNKDKDSYILLVGATGMLKDVACSLLEDYSVVCIARNESLDISAVAKQQDKECFWILEDYQHTQKVMDSLQKILPSCHSFEKAILWFHSVGLPTQEEVLAWLNHSSPNCKVWIVRSSSYSQIPKTPFHTTKYPNLFLHDVILGFVIEDRFSRWLTHDEICEGVASAVQSEERTFIVGSVEPWSLRP